MTEKVANNTNNQLIEKDVVDLLVVCDKNKKIVLKECLFTDGIINAVHVDRKLSKKDEMLRDIITQNEDIFDYNVENYKEKYQTYTKCYVRVTNANYYSKALYAFDGKNWALISQSTYLSEDFSLGERIKFGMYRPQFISDCPKVDILNYVKLDPRIFMKFSDTKVAKVLKKINDGK